MCERDACGRETQTTLETKERLCGSERLSSQAHLVFQHIQPVHSALGFTTGKTTSNITSTTTTTTWKKHTCIQGLCVCFVVYC